jgi:hypothetical protein
MSVSGLKKRLPVAAVTVLLLLLGMTGVAAAVNHTTEKCLSCTPWWHLDTISAPFSPANGEGTIVVDAANLGDAMVNATEHPVTIVDKLPTGMTATAIEPDGESASVGGTTNGKKVWEHTKCSTTPTVTVTCTYSGLPEEGSVQLLAYEHLLISIRVTVAPGSGHGVNEVSVSGGGAPPLTSRHALALSDTPLPFGLESYEMTPEEEGGGLDTQAGSHPFQLTTRLAFNTDTVLVNHVGEEAAPELEPIGTFVKDVRLALPPGLVGNPTPLPKCSMKVFVEEARGGPKCPTNTVVGVAMPFLSGGVSPQVPPPVVRSARPEEYTEPLYALEPSVGEAARFGFPTAGGPVILDATVRTGGAYNVAISVSDITQAVEPIGSQVTFWGVPADRRHDTTRGLECLHQPEVTFLGIITCAVQEKPQPFLIMPTSCTGPLRTSIEGDSWAQPGQFTTPKEYTFQNSEGEPVAQDGCNRLSFTPSIIVAPDGKQGSAPTGLTVDVHIPQDASLDPEGRAESTAKEVTVALPAGVVVNPAAADGLQSCGLGEIGLESPGEQSCPEAAKIATVEIKTPLLPNPLVGAVYLAAQNANPFGSLVAVYLVAHDPVSGVLIKLAGEVKPDPVTGQLVARFPNIPPLPFEDGVFHFFGGSRAPLGTPALCGSYSATASIVPWSGNGAAAASSPPFEITSGPNGSPCSNPLPFSPSLTTGSLNLQAGAFTPLTTTMSREDGQQALQGIQLHFPPGLSGLLSGVALCGEAQANEGTCGPGSLIGETTVSVGLGGNPFAVKGGRVYITGPYKGAPFGISVAVRAKAGPYDFGTVVVRGRIEVDPSTAALTVTTDDTGPYRIPTILDGIPLQIKHVNVLINRPGFTINPTSCSKMAVMGSLVSTEGASSNLSVPFQVTNCATLKFAPKFSVSTNARTSKAAGASLTAKVSYPSAPQGTQANLTKVKVDLPLQLPSQLKTLQKACLAKVFEANPALCPPESIVGHAKVITPLLPVPLVGPAYFVSHGNEDFPSLTIVLQGYGVTIDLVGSTFIKKGITSSTFKTVPDSPFNSFELTLPQGKYAALAANLPANAHGSFCGQNLKMPTLLVAQNGLEIHQQTPITVTGCPKAKTRAQLYAAALTACHKKHNHSKRQACERQARRKYGPVKKKK